MRITPTLITAACALALFAPNALADECGSETTNGQAGPVLAGAGSHVYMLLSQYNEDIGSSGFEQHELFDLKSGGSISRVTAPFNGATVRGASLATAGNKLAAGWWANPTGQHVLAGTAGASLVAGPAASPVLAEVPAPYELTTEIAVAPDGSGAIIDVNHRVHRFAADGTIGPAVEAGSPTAVVVNANGTAWFARATPDAKLSLYRWDLGAPAPVNVPITLPFSMSSDFDAVADGQGGVRILSRAASGAGLVTRRVNGIRDAQLDGRADGSFAVTTLKKKSGVRTLKIQAGKADDSLAKAVTVFKGRTRVFSYDTALQPGTGSLVGFAVNKGQGQLRVARIKGSKRRTVRTIKAKTSKTGFDAPQIATTSTGSAWVLFTAYDINHHDPVCGKYTNYRYIAAKVSASGKTGKPKRVPGARPLTYYVGS
jgi:hypothetical protein